MFLQLFSYVTRYQTDYKCETSLKANVVTDEGKDRNETRTLNKEMKLEELYKVGSEALRES